MKNRLKFWTKNYLVEDMLIKNPYLTPNYIQISPTIILSISSNKAVYKKASLIPIILTLEVITGQRGLLTQAKCSDAAFRLKKGMEIGVKLTLTGTPMWNFFDKFITIILPHLVYFRKFKKISYDQDGNLSMGFQNLDIFPEMDGLKDEQHILMTLGFITGADFLLIFTPFSRKKNSWEIPCFFTWNSWQLCQSSNFQIL